MDYQAALEYLYSLTDYTKDRIARYDPDALNLRRMRRVLARLGNPHERFPAVHIAGTKGKGSVAATCASVLKVAGLRTGLYTSPHLHTFRERIRVNDDLIPVDTLTGLVSECRPVFETEPELNTFEAITALAFVHFARSPVELAVVEVGLGGRLDATNVITPKVAIITSLSFDHTYLLGHTLAEIAGEKAGIIKPGVPTVSAPQAPEALSVVERVCAERGSPLTLIGRDWVWRLPPSTGLAFEGQSFELDCLHKSSALAGPYSLALLGRHQLNNATAAVAALDLLNLHGLALTARHVRQGLANVEWPGRFEVLRTDPPLVVDCAHNGDSAAKLAAALEEWFPGRRWTVILGASSDKDVPGMLRALAPKAERFVATQSRHFRAMSPQAVADIAAQTLPAMEASNVELLVSSDVESALMLTLTSGQPGCDTAEPPLTAAESRAVCVTGSIFAVANAREFWALRTGGALPATDYPIEKTLLWPHANLASETLADVG